MGTLPIPSIPNEVEKVPIEAEAAELVEASLLIVTAQAFVGPCVCKITLDRERNAPEGSEYIRIAGEWFNWLFYNFVGVGR